MKRRAGVAAMCFVVLGLLAPRDVAAQYADSPRTLAAVDQFVSGAAQIGRRLFIGGYFTRVSLPTGGAVVVDTAGVYVPGAFPRFDGPVDAIVPDGFGGWVVVGGFTRVAAVTEGTLLSLQWRAPSTGPPPTYVIEAGTAPGLSDVARLPVSGAATTFTIDAPPRRYWGRVRALNGAGPSEPSGELILDVDATDSPCYETPPLAPFNLAASVAGRSVTLTWEQPDAGPVANTQRVVAGSAPGLDNLGAIGVPGPATSFTTTAPAGTYYVRVIGFNSCGASPYSNEVQVVVP
ncbi:MAG: hypothetical protein AB7H81_24495 [Vicinamibacterales bacterium]